MLILSEMLVAVLLKYLGQDETEPLVYNYAALEFLHACQTMVNPVTVITRLRPDAALFEPVPPPAGKAGRPRKKGKRLPTLHAILDDPQTKWQFVKERPTFSDALSAVRQQLWFPATIFSMSAAEPDVVKIPRSLFDRLVHAVCYST